MSEKTDKTDAPATPKKLKRVVLKLGQQYGINMPGEVCGFTPEVAEHILKHDKAAVRVREVEHEPQGPGNIRQLQTMQAAAVLDSDAAKQVADKLNAPAARK